MRPIKLTMQAFGSYGKQTPVDFTRPNQNLFLITGDTGAGKSTIFDAIVFALYGEASSGNNKKDGMELQSQFVDYDITPFVELIFSENAGGQEEIYTVRRVPRHIRPLKKGSGMKDEKETVSLIMPDGSQYSQNQKETDAKLEEIVGLTKNQFMQVAMIAQGEFMELLRAKSDEKKIIFRKLFNTELFQEIVNELGTRRQKQKTRIGQIKTACQTEIEHTKIPSNYNNALEMNTLKEQIVSSDRFDAVNMEEYLKELEILCQKLEEMEHSTSLVYEKKRLVRDQRRDAYTSALTLESSFAQLENAGKDLEECKAREGLIKETEALIGKINGAYEIKNAYDRYQDALTAQQHTEKNLKTQQTLLPELEKIYLQAAQNENTAQAAQEEALKYFTKVSENVAKALEIFERIHNALEVVEKAQKSYDVAVQNEVKKQKQLQDFEARELEWQRKSEELADANMHLELWKKKSEDAKEIDQEVVLVEQAWNDVNKQKEKVSDASRAYMSAKNRYMEKNARYLEKQQAFFDAQAGLLATQLKEGMPCPVCGSIEHPNPCRLLESHENLTREEIDRLAGEVSGLNEKQSRTAAACSSAMELLKEKEKNASELTVKLISRMKKTMGNIPDDLTVAAVKQRISEWKIVLQKEGSVCSKNAQILLSVQEALKGAEEKKRVLRNTCDAASSEVSDAKARLAAAKSGLESFYGQKIYESESEAEAALEAARKAKNEKDQVYKAARVQAQSRKTEAENARALIRQFETVLPDQQEECRQRKTDYYGEMKEKDISQEIWTVIVGKYAKTEAARLQKDVDAFKKKKASAQGALKAAQEAIGTREKPMMENLREQMDTAEKELQSARHTLDVVKQYYDANKSAYDALAPKMEERGRILKEYTTIDSLYNRLAGNVTGGRMDIETFVQRYYLQRILYAANARFSQMSAGQFELRMIDAKQAGEGKNRGLDLMVYSAVTGKEREVRTLSGGESFMAALALALGMADQIRESSASINLDVMFIDEGFGSLDDHSRDQAVKVLQHMASGSKLVGIISHVTELKQEIEDQLIVRKDDDGSHVTWQIS